MEALLLACTAAALILTGISWFVGSVHYPLFASVGPERFAAYHDAHSRLTTRVVLGPMLIELVTAWLLLLDPPAGETALVLVGTGLATATWALTVFAAVPEHRALAEGCAAEPLRRLLRANRARTLAWAGHSAVCLLLIAAVA
jgi:hypothetical protein